MIELLNNRARLFRARLFNLRASLRHNILGNMRICKTLFVEGILIDTLILLLVIFILILLNVACFTLFKKGKLNLYVSGIIMIILAPVIGFSSGALLLHFYDWSSGGTGEGAGYGGALLGLLTLANGILILIIGFIRSIVMYIKNGY